MRFPKYGNYSLDVSGNVLEVFATGAWNLKTTEFFIEEMHELIVKFDNKPWAALMDGRRWVLSLERTHPSKHRDFEASNYERDYFHKYFEALNWLHKEGFSPIVAS